LNSHTATQLNTKSLVLYLKTW